MAHRKVILKGEPSKYERAAVAAVTPGFLCEFTSADKVQKHSTAGGNAYALFALDDFRGDRDIDDDYDADDMVQLAMFAPGDEVCARLANGETAVIGSKLESNGDGYLRVVDADASWGAIAVHSIIAVALEAVDMSGSSAVDPSGKIKVMTI